MRSIMQRGRRSSAVLLIGIVAGALIASTASVLAAIPDSGTGVITACLKASTGAIRVIDAEAGQTCSKSETTLAWNQAGAPGPAGQDGADGAEGPQGPEGPAGVPDLVVSTSNFEIGPGESQASVDCPENMEATGGGYQISSYPGDYQKPYVFGNGPVLDDEFGVPFSTGWFIAIPNGTLGSGDITGYLWAICVEA